MPQSLQTLQAETGLTYRSISDQSTRDLEKAATDGKWPQVLRILAPLTLAEEVVVVVYG